jgi:RNA polymerase sigma factor (sigma-70 family)
MTRGIRFRAAVMLGYRECSGTVRMSPLTDKATAPSTGDELAARFSAPLLTYFLRRVRDRCEAEDLVQDALLRVIRASECEVIEHPESYVFKVAANLLKDSRRHALRHPTVNRAAAVEETAGEVEEMLIDERSPERVLDGETSLAQVMRALSELSELTRNVFILFRLEHMKQKDIAALYGIGQSTVEKHVMRAVLHLARRCAPS